MGEECQKEVAGKFPVVLFSKQSLTPPKTTRLRPLVELYRADDSAPMSVFEKGSPTDVLLQHMQLNELEQQRGLSPGAGLRPGPGVIENGRDGSSGQ